MRDIILASSSPYRRAILDKIALTYHSISPQIDEKSLKDETAANLVCRLAHQKALKVAANNPDSLIIGSDQVALLEGNILGKPHTVENAERQLASCSAKIVSFHTGLCLLDSKDNSYQLEEVIFKVHFKKLSATQISRYISLERPLDCAGSFKAEGLGICLFDKLEGDDFNSLIGLPLIRLLHMLNTKGISPLS
ncbi:MAG: Maf family protein [Oceanospirillaceae bacterium]